MGRVLLKRSYNGKGKYELYQTPDERKIVLYTEDMEQEVNCTSCGRVEKFGYCYTSKEIHTIHGLGYPVCKDCYNEEIERRRASREETL